MAIEKYGESEGKANLPLGIHKILYYISNTINDFNEFYVKEIIELAAENCGRCTGKAISPENYRRNCNVV